ncbi:FAD/NAD(P)-binding protein [Chroococcus sp. FPU101]|uniref:FAD/NAD(P)-binding protein n=1 Tax=Chroococcus sp. FPU101 TaxID=1974212 RepID=UPI001A8FD1E8|nr:FAD/NAD(P)-binding protein [Chroococcus sp. FPU101]GFE70504.1 beta-lactamase domain-containing protein [Chroococcus sp. FPU101]
MVKATTIAIIGGGFSGTMVAVQLLRLANCPLKIKLIEKRVKIGQGVAYSTPILSHLLNVPVSKMSAFPEIPEHFLNWIQDRYPKKSFTGSTFAPRRYYGEYLQSVLQEAQNYARKDVYLEYIQDEAHALQAAHEQMIVTCRSGATIKADRVILALGNLPPSHPPIDDPSFYQSRRYSSWAWSTPLENMIEPDHNILLIGSGLTAIDLVIDLYYKGHQGKIYLVSRRGLLPQPHKPIQVYAPLIELDQNLNHLFKQIRSEVKKAQDLGYDWRSVIDFLRPHTQLIWKSLSITEKRRFLRHLRSYWDIHRHRISPDIAQIITKLRDSQQLIILRGEIQSYQEEIDKVTVTIRPRYTEQTQDIQVHHVVNCTGSERLTSQWQNPLLKNIITSELAKPDALQLGLDVAENGALVNNIGDNSSILYTLGPLQKGCLWETTAVPEIRQQAEKLAKELLNSL